MKVFVLAAGGVLVCNAALFQDTPKKPEDQDDNNSIYFDVVGQPPVW